MATKAKAGTKSVSKKTARAPARAGADAAAEEEVEVQVCLVLALPGGTSSVTAPVTGTLYPETDPNAGYEMCVRLSGLDDTRLGRNAQGHWRLRDWVGDVLRVVVYPYGSDPMPASIVDAEYIGLTSVTIQTETKGMTAITNMSVPPFTQTALKEMGLI